MISRLPNGSSCPRCWNAPPMPLSSCYSAAWPRPRTSSTPWHRLRNPEEGMGGMISDDDRLAAELAAEAGRRLLALRARGGDPDALRDEGDRRSHEFLAACLALRRPGDALLSEEGRDSRARLSARRVWIVDPLDGTREFGEPGRTDWAVHVALWEEGELTAGAVALPAQAAVLSTAEPPPAPPAMTPGRPVRVLVSRTRPPALLDQPAQQV